jgi:hypothetical protein
LILITAIVGNLSAQQPKIGIDDNAIKEKFFQYFFRKDTIRNGNVNLMNWGTAMTQLAKLSGTLKNGDKVCLLPSDNMSCIVTEMSHYNYNMPVAKGKMEGIIPNASPLQQIIPNEKIGSSK